MTVAIIAEMNPPHTGHAHLIDEVRRFFGKDTCILVLLSGNYMQRGDFAFLDKYARAAGALSIGADLVFELPFPYSYGTAQIYANAAVRLLDSLSCVDYLAFGSEEGSLKTLKEITSYLSSPDFTQDYTEARVNFSTKSFIQIRTDLIRKHLSDSAAQCSSLPNNILGIEYLLALSGTASSIKPFTIPRIGSYHEKDDGTCGYLSAGAIRDAVVWGRYDDIRPYITAKTAALLSDALRYGRCPASLEKVFPVFVTAFRRMGKGYDFSQFFDIDQSLSDKMKAALEKAADLSQFISLLKARHLTDAHIRRAVFNAYFGITSSEMQEAPAYTRLLAMNKVGRESLKHIKQHSTLPIIIRPSEVLRIPTGRVKTSADLADFADSLYLLSLPHPQSAATLLKYTPVVME